MEDRQIIKLFFSRSEHAIRELEQTYGKLLQQLAFRILGSEEDAEECVNDTYLAVWNAIPPQNPDLLKPYLCRILRNQALKRRSKNTAAKRNNGYDVALEELAECLPGKDQPEDAVIASALGRLINSFLLAQAKENRALFIRRYYLAESIEEIAEAFRMRPNTVSARLARIRRSLQSYLNRNWFDRS